jgi:hypothetical protein
MKNKDFVPSADATFSLWQRVLIAYLLANLDRFGLVAAWSEVVSAIVA